MAMIIPISTNTTIAACIQIQVGDMIESKRIRDRAHILQPTVLAPIV